MAIYLICFIVSCIFLKLSEFYKKNKRVCFAFVIIALFIPCLLAGMRNYKVGTDVNTYVKPMYECALDSDGYNDYLNKCWTIKHKKIRCVSEFEIGFRFLIYSVTKITGNFQFLLFLIQIIIILPVYLGLKKFKALDNRIWLGMLVFYLMFYNITLNAIRQFMAVSIMFYALSSVINGEIGKNTIKFLVLLGISTLFHMSSLLTIFVYLIYLIYFFINCEKENTKVIKIFKHVIPLNKFLTYIIIFIGILVVMNSSILVELLSILNLDSYSNYIEGNVTFVKSSIIKILPISFLFVLVGKEFVKKYKNAYFFVLLFAMDCLIMQFGSVSAYAGRIGYIFAIFDVVFFPKLVDSSENKSITVATNIALIVYMVFYWYYNFVMIGRGETIPYTFYKI